MLMKNAGRGRGNRTNHHVLRAVIPRDGFSSPRDRDITVTLSSLSLMEKVRNTIQNGHELSTSLWVNIALRISHFPLKCQCQGMRENTSKELMARKRLKGIM
jgi:hypothetical protein